MGVRPSSFGPTGKPAALPQEQLFDTHPEVSLDFEIVRQATRQKYTRPFLILDNAIVREKARRFRAAMPRVQPHYAVKANPDRRVLKTLMQEGCSFEIASTAELDMLLAIGADPAGVFYSNPMKSRQSIAYAAAKGVEWFVVDSVDELRRTSAAIGRCPENSARTRRRRAKSSPPPPSSAPISRARRSTPGRNAATRRTGASASKSRACCSTP
jgi:pyridoxal-dependent decarboxylase-like protein